MNSNTATTSISDLVKLLSSPVKPNQQTSTNESMTSPNQQSNSHDSHFSSPNSSEPLQNQSSSSSKSNNFNIKDLLKNDSTTPPKNSNNLKVTQDQIFNNLLNLNRIETQQASENALLNTLAVSNPVLCLKLLELS